MNAQDPRWIGWLERGYAVALWLYPREFRREWGPAMRQAFRDRCREVARGERRPTSLAAELMPDLIVGLGREHCLARSPQHGRALTLQLGLLALLAGLLLLRGPFADALSRGIEDVRVAWVRWQDKQDAQALAEYRAARADALGAHAASAREHTIAGLLYAIGDGWVWPEDWTTQHTATGRSDGPGADVRRQSAQTQWALALAAGDRLALWQSVLDCPVEHCDAAARRRLAAADPDNAAIVLLQVDAALATNDEDALQAAFARLAQATHYHSYHAEAMQSLLATDRNAVPVPSRLRMFTQGDATANADWLDATFWWILAHDPVGRILRYCPSGLPAAQDARRADCLAIGRWMSGGDSTLARAVGLRIWYRQVYGSPGAQEVIRRMRDFRWQRHQGSQFLDQEHPEVNRAWRRAWLRTGSEVAATRAVVLARGKPLQAPADYKLERGYFAAER